METSCHRVEGARAALVLGGALTLVGFLRKARLLSVLGSFVDFLDARHLPLPSPTPLDRRIHTRPSFPPPISQTHTDAMENVKEFAEYVKQKDEHAN